MGPSVAVMTTTTTRTPTSLQDTARRLVDGGRGILAADESIGTMSKRLEEAGVPPTEGNRCDYRELLVTTDRLADGITGVIFCDETLRQHFADGRDFPTAVADLGLMPGIKVDTGTKPLAGADDEKITEGLDGLADRVAEYVELGATFAKWRAALDIDEGRPSHWALLANAHALARYARVCQDGGLVPMVEPEVLADGTHSLAESAAATARALALVARALEDAGVDPGGMILKPNMITSGLRAAEQASPEEVARATVDTLGATMSDEIAGIAFLSGGQSSETAAANLAAIRELSTPWPTTFSFGRALVSPALTAWQGNPWAIADAQAALTTEVRRNVVMA